MATPNTLAAILKAAQDEMEISPDEALARTSNFMTSMKHIKDFQTKTIDWSVAHAGLGGGSHDATTAEANDVNVAAALFSISPRHDYSKRTLDGQLVRQTLRGGVNDQFFNYVQGEIKLAQGVVNQNIARGSFGSSTGRRGVRGSVSSAVLTLSPIEDALNFAIGDKVVAAQTDGGTLRDSGDFVTLIGVNTATGELTADANWSNIASMADGDSLYRKGDINLSYKGLGTSCPATAPSGGDAVYGAGVDRSVNPEMLAGIRLSFTGASPETVLIRAMAYCKRRPGNPFAKCKIIASLEDVATLAVAKEGAKVIDSSDEYGIGITGFHVGTAPVMDDAFCPTGTYFIVGDGAVEFHSNDGVNVDEADGNSIRKTAGDTYALVALCDGEFKPVNPAAIARGTWPSS